MPTTAKMKTMMASTRVRLPSAPTELPMILISMLRVGQDLASLNTLNYKTDRKQVYATFTVIMTKMFELELTS